MNGRNLFFASVFTKELERWKKDGENTQADFAYRTGIHPNMISRYKKGTAFPTPPVLEVISQTLGVKEDIFFPQSPVEKAAFDDEYRLNLLNELVEIESELIKSFGISTAFWAFFTSIDHIYDLFPFEIAPANEWQADMVWGKKNSSGKCVGFTSEDLRLVKHFQDEAATMITSLSVKELIIKDALNQPSNPVDNIK